MLNTRIQSGGWAPSPYKAGEWLRISEASLCYGDLILSDEGWTYNGPGIARDPFLFSVNETTVPEPWLEERKT